MIASIVQHGLQVDHRIAGQRPVDACLPEALLHGGEEVLGYGAAEDLLGKLHLLRVGVGLEADPHVAELAGAAGLLLVAALLGDGLADLLPVGYPGRLQLRLHIEAALQLGHQHIHLDIAGGVNDHLVGLGVVLHPEGGVLLVHPVQALGHLVLLAAGLGGDGHRVVGLGEGDGGQGDDLSGVAQGVAGLYLLHLADGADVAAGELLDLLGLLAPHLIQPAQLLAVAGAGIHQGQVGGDVAGQDLDEGVFAVLIGHRLKYEGARHAAGGYGKLLLGAVGGGALAHIALGGVGEQVHNVVHEHQGAHGVDGGAAQHREQGQLPHALAQALDHLDVGEVLAGEELVHKLLAGLGHRLLQSVVELGDHLVLPLGEVDLHPLAVLHLIGALVQHVNDAGDPLVVVPDGDHQGGDLVAEALPQGVEGGVVVGVLLVGLGDIDETGHIPLFAVLPRLLQAHADAVLGGADDDGRVGHGEGLHHIAGKVKGAGGVQNVDLTALVLQRGHRGGDGNLTFDLLRIIVAHGVSVRGFAHAVDGAGHIEQALRQSGLAAPAVAQKADIADVLYRIAHGCFHSLKFRRRCHTGERWAARPWYNLLVIIT